MIYLAFETWALFRTLLATSSDCSPERDGTDMITIQSGKGRYQAGTIQTDVVAAFSGHDEIGLECGTDEIKFRKLVIGLLQSETLDLALCVNESIHDDTRG